MTCEVIVMVDLETLEPLGDDWWHEQARIVGATQRQAAFARTMIENPGAKFNKVAELAGIEGTPHYLRTAGSDLAKHPKVKRLYELALVAKVDEEVEIAYPPELLKQLSEIARNDTSTNNRLKANELLLKYHDRFQETNRQLSDTDLLEEFCKDGHPASTLYAIHCADELGMQWTPPGPQLARLRAVPAYRDIIGALGLSKPMGIEQVSDLNSPIPKTPLN
jgi:hypothetical protein